MARENVARALALLVLLTLVTAACGQKPGVHLGFSGGGGATGMPGAAGVPPVFTDADGDGREDTSGLTEEQFADSFDDGGGDSAAVRGGSVSPGAAPAGQSGQGGTGTGRPGGGSAGTGPAAQDGGGQAGASSGDRGDSTGVSDTTIKLGMHVPLTGAAPLPASSFDVGKDQYWRAGNTVAGRKVEVLLRDDKYNPSSASQVCQELVHREKVFLLIGTGGTDQIAECARIADSAGVPYVSVGVTELRLDRLASYFSLSMSYAQQMPLLMQFITKHAPPANKKVALIASNTANFDDAVAAYQKAAQRFGLTAVVYRPSKQASDGELAGVAQRMAADQVTIATPLMAPTQWIRLASNPQLRSVGWHGVGVTMGLNTVAVAVCQSAGGAVEGSTFLSPWPGLNMANELDANFNGKGGGGDDIQWSLWGLNKTLHAALDKMGADLTRQAFARAMTGPVRSGVFPNLKHTASNHFGAQDVHQLRLDCSKRQYTSTRATTFRRGF